MDDDFVFCSPCARCHKGQIPDCLPAPSGCGKTCKHCQDMRLKCHQLPEDTLAQIEALKTTLSLKMVLDTAGLTSGERRCEDGEESSRRGEKRKQMRKTLAETASDVEFVGEKSAGKSHPKGALWASPGLELMFERLLGAIITGLEEVRKAIEANMEAVADSNYKVGLLHSAIGAVAESVLNQN